MISRFTVCLALAFVALSDAPSMAQFRGRGRGGPPAGPYGWLSSLEAGKARARDSGKPLMVVIRCVP